MRRYILCSLYLWIGVCAFAQTNGVRIGPAHESSIIMLGMHETEFFSLDDNGLLRIYNSKFQLKDFRIPVRTPLAYAFYDYPYIVMVDVQSKMHVYNIENDFIPYTSTFLSVEERGAISISKDKSLLAYTSAENIKVLDLNRLATISTLPYSNAPIQFLVISHNKQNLMSVQKLGKIEYHSIANGEVIKAIDSQHILDSIALNSTLRYATGFSGKTLQSIDVIDGKIVDSILFTNDIVDIFPSPSSNSGEIQINMVMRYQDGTLGVRIFDFLENGNLEENDILSISVPKFPSFITGEKSSLYVGFEDGEIWDYRITPETSIAKTLVEDDTLAIYDAIVEDNTLLMSSTDGLISLPLSPNGNTAEIHEQPLLNSSFLTWTSNTSDTRTIALLSSNTPYQHLAPPLSPPIFIPRKSAIFSPAVIIPESSPSLLFSLNKDVPSLEYPNPYPKDISIMRKNDTLEVFSSDLNSTLYISRPIKENQSMPTPLVIPLVSSRFLFDLGTSREGRPLLWTNTPLTIDNNSIPLQEVSSNLLYSYNYVDGEKLQRSIMPLQLNFVSSKVYDFKSLSDPLTFLVVSHDEPTEKSSLYYMETDTPQQSTQDKNTASEEYIFPSYVALLHSIVDERPLKLLVFPTNDDRTIDFALFTDKRMHIVSIGKERTNLAYQHSIQYPPTFGIFLNAQVTQSAAYLENENSTHTYTLSLVDKNNTLSLLIITTGSKGLENIDFLQSFNILEDYSVRYHQ